jgi:predicted permease
VPRLSESQIDTTVLAFTFGISLLASLLFGLVPAIHATRVDLNETLKQGAARAVVGGSASNIRHALVVAEIALSVILLTGAGLLIKSFVALHNVALGFRPEHVLVMDANVPSASSLESQRHATQLFKNLLAEISALPGVSAVGATMVTPGHGGPAGNFWGDFMPSGPSVKAPFSGYSVITPGTFAALGIPLKSGRDFDERDTYDAPFTAIVNAALVRRAFPGQDPLGHVIFCGLDDSTKPLRIVGVVGNVRRKGPASEPVPEIYLPYEQHPNNATALKFLIRSPLATGTLSETLRHAVHERSPDVPVKFTTMEASLYENLAAPRFRTLLLGIFAGLAICLAMAGIYGVLAYIVGQRSNEIGLRMALGASTADVLRLVLEQGIKLTAIGLALGLLGSFAAGRVLTSMLFAVKPSDPGTYTAVAALLMLVTLAASYVPARRATKIDPFTALRQE